ncbi:fatty acid synthase subunit alpha [Colletotrichum liriopes]|uniref:Fatty acid synthase subunit alpha n=1 Tax=Colletotrichum liriopes TaxID=708192 RepID=A0AA37GBI0_9PEZI|nr:fatty acid synthase subunit alpha [Colletotrichum liriopes]
MPTEVEIAEHYKKQIEDDVEHSIKEAQGRYGNNFWRREPSISPLSLHGTSTKENDFNETAVIQSQLGWLGRTKGNVLPYVLEKSLLGHGKGAAGPGHPLLPSRTYKNAAELKAFSVTSFGFGQKGAQVVGVNSRYLVATLSEQEYEVYRSRARRRERGATKAVQEATYGGTLVKVKEASVYEDEDLEKILLSR